MPATDDLQQASSRKKSNLATAFKIAGLSAPRVRAMEILYTYCRVADDIVDEPGEAAAKHAALDAWRGSIRGFFNAPGGTPPHDTLAGELASVVRDYGIPMPPLLEILDGCAMDIAHAPYADSVALHRYCHGVACAVGLASIHVFGCVSPLSEQYAEALGYALQFTNILRDVAEDYRELGRVYLPRDEMAAFGVRIEELVAPVPSPACQSFFHLQYLRAKHYFNKARRLIAPEDFEALKAARLMGEFYERILEKIRAGGFRLGGARIRLGKIEKLRALLAVRHARAPFAPPPPPRRVVVVGAGVAGCAAAAAATLSGDTVLLLESSDRIGGRAADMPAPRAAALPSGLRVDNGHHAIFGCYDNFLRLVDILGARGKLRETTRLDIPYRSPVPTRTARLRATAFLPAPLHLLAALVRFRELSWSDRAGILRLALRLRLGCRAAMPRTGETAAAWLARHGQTPGAIRAVWEPFCIAALNETLQAGAATLLHATLRRTLFGPRVTDSAVHAARETLGALFTPELSLALRATGGELRLSAPVRAIEGASEAAAAETAEAARDGQGRAGGGASCPAATAVAAVAATATAVVLADGTRISADAVVCAVPHRMAARLFGGEPDATTTDADSAFATNPILNVHLFTRRPIFAAPCCALLDSPVQWIFSEAAVVAQVVESSPSPLLQHYALTLSQPGAEWMRLSQDEVLARVRGELARFFPDFDSSEIVAAFVVKTPAATYAATPAALAARAPLAPPFRNVFLAGDWTLAAELPSTLESAAESGFRAAGHLAAPVLR